MYVVNLFMVSISIFILNVTFPVLRKYVLSAILIYDDYETCVGEGNRDSQ